MCDLCHAWHACNMSVVCDVVHHVRHGSPVLCLKPCRFADLQPHQLQQNQEPLPSGHDPISPIQDPAEVVSPQLSETFAERASKASPTWSLWRKVPGIAMLASVLTNQQVPGEGWLCLFCTGWPSVGSIRSLHLRFFSATHILANCSKIVHKNAKKNGFFRPKILFLAGLLVFFFGFVFALRGDSPDFGGEESIRTPN